MVAQLLHGCRQLVPWGVPLSWRTSATRIRCYKCHRRLPWFFPGRKERTTSSQHGAYNLGNTHPTMANNNGMLDGNVKQIPTKFRLSSDWGLQPDLMKSESVVIANQKVAVNTFSGLVQKWCAFRRSYLSWWKSMTSCWNEWSQIAVSNGDVGDEGRK